MITNTIPTKHGKRRSKRMNKESKHSIFYLDQPQMATTAKSDLLSQALWNQDNKSLLIFTQPNKYIQQFNNTYDSWHGQRHISIKKIGNPFIEKIIQDKSKTTSRIPISSENNRRGTKSVGSVQLRRSYRNTDTPIKKKSQFVTKAGLGLNNKLVHIIPKLESQSSFRSIKYANCNSKRHKSAKSSLVDFKSNQKKILLEAKVNSYEKGNDEIVRKNIVIGQNLVRQKQKNSKGALGTTLKQKRNKKMSWLHMKKSSNQTRLNKFTATNSPINKQLNKIISLLQSENNFNCF